MITIINDPLKPKVVKYHMLGKYDSVIEIIPCRPLSSMPRQRMPKLTLIAP